LSCESAAIEVCGRNNWVSCQSICLIPFSTVATLNIFSMISISAEPQEDN